MGLNVKVESAWGEGCAKLLGMLNDGVLWKAIEDQQQVRGTFYFWIPTIWVALV
jgi:hypothetical protein